MAPFRINDNIFAPTDEPQPPNSINRRGQTIATDVYRAITITLDADGTVECIRLHDSWKRGYSAAALPNVIMSVYQNAMKDYLTPPELDESLQYTHTTDHPIDIPAARNESDMETIFNKAYYDRAGMSSLLKDIYKTAYLAIEEQIARAYTTTTVDGMGTNRAALVTLSTNYQLVKIILSSDWVDTHQASIINAELASALIMAKQKISHLSDTTPINTTRMASLMAELEPYPHLRNPEG